MVKQQKLSRNVVTCNEAGASGFLLHRPLEELGIKNYVVQPQDSDEHGKGLKNDRFDAAAPCQPLDPESLLKNPSLWLRIPSQL